MDKVEYAKRMAEIEEMENKKRESKDDDNFPTDSSSQKIAPDEVDELIQKVEETKQPHEIEDKLEEEEKEQEEISKQNEELKNMPSLREFMKTEEFLRLGTKAKIPVPLDINGFQVKVFVRALSRNEIQACRVQAQHTDEDMDFLAVMKACTDENGEPFDRETLDQLGYARIRDISEAIGIASGESPENTESAIRKKVIDDFLQKFTDEA